MGQVILASFANPEGLHQVNGAWRESFGSGSALLGQPGSSSLGRIRSGALEESNVDVTQELVSMISAQRTFQANAQVISTYDTVTQTVINMRR
jgi:flagellar hook protein FlgE